MRSLDLRISYYFHFHFLFLVSLMVILLILVLFIDFVQSIYPSFWDFPLSTGTLLKLQKIHGLNYFSLSNTNTGFFFSCSHFLICCFLPHFYWLRAHLFLHCFIKETLLLTKDLPNLLNFPYCFQHIYWPVHFSSCPMVKYMKLAHLLILFLHWRTH